MKYVKLISFLTMLAVCLSLLAGCGKGKSNEALQGSGNGDESQNVFEQMQNIAESNSAKPVGGYETPAEGDFLWEELDNGVAITSYSGSATAIQIPDQLGGKPVCAIGEEAFTQRELTGVKIPDSVTMIGVKAFCYCTALKEVQLGSGVKTIDREAFEGCLALTDVKLNDGLEMIGDSAFGTTPSLTAITIPNTVTLLDAGAFVLSGLEEITVPGSVQTIGEQAFSTCENLTRAVLEEGVVSVAFKAFEDCQKLEVVELPASATELEEMIFVYTDGVTIHAPAGSAAEAYAKENELAFQAK